MKFTNIVLPKPIDETALKQIIPFLKMGDPDAIQQTIEGHMRLTAAITAKFAWKFPSRAYDLFGAGLIALVTSVNRVASAVACTEHDNISAYIHKYVFYELVEYLKQDHLIRPPLNSEWLKEQDAAFYCREFDPISLDNDDCASFDANGEQKMPKVITQALAQIDHGFNFIEQDLLESEFFTNRERIILQMRLQGRSHAEIGRSIGYTERQVYRFLEDMRPRAEKVIWGRA